jgi:hypothetical protein
LSTPAQKVSIEIVLDPPLKLSAILDTSKAGYVFTMAEVTIPYVPGLCQL